MQSMINNPEFLRSFLDNNPAYQRVIQPFSLPLSDPCQLAEQNPEVAQVLNNPEMIRESLRLLSNPNLMQEHMRNMDRAMSNLESIPGGFNALRQIYETIQEPLLNDSQPRNQDNPFSALFDQNTQSRPPQPQQPPTSGSINTAPLPNPWAPPQTTRPPSFAPTNPLGAGGLPGNPDGF